MAEGRPIVEVNIELGDDMSKMFDIAAQATYDNIQGAVWRPDGHFRGSRGIDCAFFAHQAVDSVLGQGFDGIGTKVEIRERMQYTEGKGASHAGSAYDLLAMVCDDAPRDGSQVVSWGSVLDTGRLNEEDPYTINGMRELATGMVQASKEAGVVCINGEIAELIGRVIGYGTFNYNWGAGVLTLKHKSRTLTGKELKPGHFLVGLPERGPRCNGMTDYRTQFEEHFGPEWHNETEASLGGLTLGEVIQIPATIYHGLMTELTGGWDIRREPKANITGFAHITGGGQRSKLNTMIEGSDVGLTIYDPIEPPAHAKLIQRLSGFSDMKAYGKWHMGPGAVIATTEPYKVVDLAFDAGIEGAQIIGEATDEPGIRVLNRGVVRDEEWLTF